MSFTVSIDHCNRRIVARWGSTASADVFAGYLRTARGDPTVRGYDELMDLTALQDVQVSSQDAGALLCLGGYGR
jgi:hypothetical protein